MLVQHVALDGPDEGIELALVERGDATAGRIVLCVHGLTRNARDFDALAERLAAGGARVFCVDVAGRGASSWLPDPMDYRVPVYARQIASMLRRLGIDHLDWVGTSMGGLIALELARTQEGIFHRLVLNDIGPFCAREALEPIRSYLGLDLSFPSIDEVERHLRVIHAGFGPLDDAVWRHLAVHSARREGDLYRLHYDPRIREPFLREAAADIEMWDAYERLCCPTLVLRGAESSILDPATAEAMTRRGPAAELVTFAGVGHAPALFAPRQIETVARFLEL